MPVLFPGFWMLFSNRATKRVPFCAGHWWGGIESRKERAHGEPSEERASERSIGVRDGRLELGRHKFFEFVELAVPTFGYGCQSGGANGVDSFLCIPWLFRGSDSPLDWFCFVLLICKQINVSELKIVSGVKV